MYPQIEPYHTQMLDVGDGHRLYVEQSGRADGLPAVYLHGGPGGGSSSWFRQYFDPAIYRIIVFDQRGAGKSTPYASLENNTTDDLIRDLEQIRKHLSIDRWLVFGGSWGSTLALAYAQTHPDVVSALVLRGIFLCRDEDLQWFYQSGADRIFPEVWQEYIAPIDPADRDDMIAAYYKVLTGDDEDKKLMAAKAWSSWEGRTITLRPDPQFARHFASAEVALALARIECHYFINHCFLEPDQLIRDIGRIRHLPGVIVHGRYDVVCPVNQATALAAAWPEAELHIIDDAGHAASEPGIAMALLDATDRLGKQLA